MGAWREREREGKREEEEESQNMTVMVNALFSDEIKLIAIEK